jgi:hypothetical protein
MGQEEEQTFSGSKPERARSRDKPRPTISSDRRPRGTYKATSNSNMKRNLILPRSMKSKKVVFLEGNLKLMVEDLVKELDSIDQDFIDAYVADLKDFESNLTLAEEDPGKFYYSSIGKSLMTIKDVLLRIDSTPMLGLDVKQAISHVDTMLILSSKILGTYVRNIDLVLR